MAAVAAGMVRLETAVTGAATARGHRLFECRVAGAGIGHAAGERIANGPEPVATLAEAERIDGLEFVAAEDRHFGVVRTVRAGGLRGCRRACGDLAAKVGEDRLGVAFPVSPGSPGPGLSKPLIICAGHRRRIGGQAGAAQEPAGIGV